MKPLLFWTMRDLLGSGAIYSVAVNREVAAPLLRQVGIDPDGFWTRSVLKVIAIPLAGLPVAGPMGSIASLGSDRAGCDVHGYSVLKPHEDARYFFTLASLALTGLIIFVGADPQERLIFRGFMAVFGVAVLFAGFWVFEAHVRYDNSTSFAIDYSGLDPRHEGADLEGIPINALARDCHLLFRRGRKARISFFYSGANDMMTLVWQKLKTNARAS